LSQSANSEKPCCSARTCNNGDVTKSTSSMTHAKTFRPVSSMYEHR